VTYIGLLLATGFLVSWLSIQIKNHLKKQRSDTSQLLLPKFKNFLVLATIGLLTGVTPAALTWESVPHAIRSLGAWPFFVMFAIYGWTVFLSFFPKLRGLVVMVSVICFGAYLQSYFFNYPKISGPWFDQSAVEAIRSTGQFPSNYQKVSQAYYRMHLMNERCENIQEEFR
jgi:hypothetical protein